MRTPKKSRIRFLRFEKSSRTSRLNFDEFFSSSSNQTAQQPLIVTTSTPCHPIVIDPQSIHPYEKKDETFQQLQVHISKLILYHDVHTGYVNVKVSVCNKTISFASVSAEKVNHEYGVCTLFQFQLGKNAVFPAIETSEMMSAFEVESNVAVFNTKAVGKFNICCETLTTNGIIKNAVPILVENKKVGEIEVSFYSKVEGFLDDSASEDSDQASASPTPMPSRRRQQDYIPTSAVRSVSRNIALEPPLSAVGFFCNQTEKASPSSIAPTVSPITPPSIHSEEVGILSQLASTSISRIFVFATTCLIQLVYCLAVFFWSLLKLILLAIVLLILLPVTLDKIEEESLQEHNHHHPYHHHHQKQRQEDKFSNNAITPIESIPESAPVIIPPSVLLLGVTGARVLFVDKQEGTCLQWETRGGLFHQSFASFTTCTDHSWWTIMASSLDQWQIRHSDNRCLGIRHNPTQKVVMREMELFPCVQKSANTTTTSSTTTSNIFMDWSLNATTHTLNIPTIYHTVTTISTTTAITSGNLIKQPRNTKHKKQHHRVGVVVGYDKSDAVLQEVVVISQVSESTPAGYVIRNQDFFGVSIAAAVQEK